MLNERQPDTIARLERQAEMLTSPQNGAPEYMDSLVTLAMELLPAQFAHALSLCHEPHVNAELLRHGRGFANNVTRSAWLQYLRGNIDGALVQAAHAEAIADSVDSDSLRCGARAVLALIRQHVGDFDAAEALWLDLLAIARRTDDAEREADYLSALAGLRRAQSRHLDALELRLRAHHLYLLTDNRRLPLSCNSLSLAYISLGRFDSAVRWAQQAIHVCGNGSSLWRGWFMHTLGLCHLEQGKLDAAQRHMEEALFVCKTGSNDAHTQVRILIDLGRLHCAANRPSEAIQHGELAMALLARFGDCALEGHTHRVLYEAYQLIGAHDLARTHNERRAQLHAKRDQTLSVIAKSARSSRAHAGQLRSVWSTPAYSVN